MRLYDGMLLLAMLFFPVAVSAAPIYDQDVTPDTIYGTGTGNGSFAVDLQNNVELGLRASLRFDENNQSQPIYNSDGAGNYRFPAGQPSGTGFSFAPNSASTAVWNFDWSINSDQDGTLSRSLDELTYLLEIDFDPGPGQMNTLSFDPINVTFADHAIGNNSTGNSAGTVANNATAYSSLIASNNVAQNSWNMEFFDSMTFPFDANTPGIYTITLTASDMSGALASTSINVISTVPEPSSMALLATGAVGFLGYRRRQRKLAMAQE